MSQPNNDVLVPPSTTGIQGVPALDHEPTHEEKVAAMVDAIREGKIDPNEVIVETYLFIVEMRQVMTAISSGKMGGLFGKLLGKMGGE